MTTPPQFGYEDAFSRNIGWLTEAEQQVLRGKKIAIAGMGGVGGIHLLTLTRLGIGGFHIADLDTFEVANFNRQVGATMSTLGRAKVDVLAEMAKEINPELHIATFRNGIDEKNLDAFLDGIDLYVDGLDFFVLNVRAKIFARCAELAIPAVTAAPLGMGAAYLVFMPGGMTFENYFCLQGLPLEHQYVNFLVGLSPKGLHRPYLVDPTKLNLAAKRGPSTIMACELCAGITGVEALKILLSRGKIYPAPYYHQFDAYQGKWTRGWLPGGNNNPLQRLKRHIGYRTVERQMNNPIDAKISADLTEIEKILDLARWAPSGDNTQPWRFEIKDERHIVIYGHDTRDHCVYDLQGHASQISLGTLLETITIAASARGLHTNFQRRAGLPDTQPAFDVKFTPDPTIQPSSLTPYIPLRSVQRRAMHTRALTVIEKQTLETAIAPDFRVVWLEGFHNRLRATQLTFNNAGLRLTLPEAYRTHKSIIEWNARHSNDRIPDQALGTDPMTTRMMHWALQSWERVSFLNRYLAGTLMPRIQLELIPGLACAAHFIILAKHRPETIDDYVLAGMAVQRFWLTVTQLGLHLQPEMTPLIFHEYTVNGVQFSETEAMQQRAGQISKQFERLIGEKESLDAVFMGRIGAGSRPAARSLRRPLQDLMIKK